MASTYNGDASAALVPSEITLPDDGDAFDVASVNAGMMGLADMDQYIAEMLMAVTPGGRISLTTAVPVTASDVTAATTIYYTPARHNRFPLWNGTRWVLETFTEISVATTDSTKSPAAVAADKVYDCFLWNDSGTKRLGRGAAWSNDTTRGTGAGTSELELYDGRLVNKVDITNGPLARRGLFAGTIRSNSSSQIMDSVTRRWCWNAYNRVKRYMKVTLASGAAYNSNTIRQYMADTTQQLDFVQGLREDAVFASQESLTVYDDAVGAMDLAVARVGFGESSTTTFSSLGVESRIVDMDQNRRIYAPCKWFGLTTNVGRTYLSLNQTSDNRRGNAVFGALNSNCLIYGHVMA